MPEPPTSGGADSAGSLSVCGMGRSARDAIANKTTVKPIVIGDLISYRNSGKGCTRALIGSSEP
jgi:hypothetical protein